MSLLRVKTEASDDKNVMESSVQTPARSSSYTHHLFGLITPESPTSKAVEARLVKKDYESPENAPKATLFRPWDTPESLSPSSDPISPASTLHTSPESSQHVVNLQNISPANPQYASPNDQYASYSNLQYATSNNLQHISPSNLQLLSHKFLFHCLQSEHQLHLNMQNENKFYLSRNKFHRYTDQRYRMTWSAPSSTK